MKALLLAAGFGTRLLPHSAILPKPLFPVLGIPVIDWALAALKQAGISEVTVNLHHLSGAIRNHLGDGSRTGVPVTYSAENSILGTGGAIVAAAGLLQASEGFVVHNADIFHDWDLTGLAAPGETALAVTDRPDIPEDLRRVELDSENRVTAIRGLPAQGGGRRVVYSGVSRLSCRVLERLRTAVPGWRTGQFTPACLVSDGLIPLLTEGEQVRGFEYPGSWYCDIGTVSTYLELNFRAIKAAPVLLAKRGFGVPREVSPGVFVSSEASIGRGTVLRAPCFVSAGADIGPGCEIGPNVVFGGTAAAGTSVVGAVVMGGANVRGTATGIHTAAAEVG